MSIHVSVIKVIKSHARDPQWITV